jgi:hypothetical protein
VSFPASMSPVRVSSCTEALFDAINKADTVKLMALAVFVGAASWAAARLGRLPRWLAWEGTVTVVFLVVGGLAFLASSSALNVALEHLAAAAAVGGYRQHQHHPARRLARAG